MLGFSHSTLFSPVHRDRPFSIGASADRLATAREHPNFAAAGSGDSTPVFRFLPTPTPRSRARLSQERAGLWLGLSPHQGQRYATGEQKIPEPVAKLLRLVISLELAPIDVD
jgi:hypothetical protein